MIEALPSITRDETTESLKNVLSLLEEYANAELADDLMAASGRIFDFWVHGSWRDVVDALLEVSSRSKLELFWSFLQHAASSSAAKHDARQLCSVFEMQQGVIGSALRTNSPHLDWIGREADSSLSTPFMFSGISQFRLSNDRSIPENAATLEVLYIRQCATFAHMFHEHGRASDSEQALDRLIDRYEELAGVTSRVEISLPEDVRRYLVMGLIYMLGWATWKLERGSDHIAEKMLRLITARHFKMRDVVDAWCSLPAAEDGAGIIPHLHSWERSGEMRPGKTYTGGTATFSHLGFVAMLLISHHNQFEGISLELEENRLYPIEKAKLKRTVKRLETIAPVADQLKAVAKKPVNTLLADAEALLEPVRRDAKIRALRSVLEREVCADSLDSVRAVAEEKILSAYEGSTLLGLAQRAAQANIALSGKHSFAKVLYADFSKADLLGENDGPKRTAEHMFSSASGQLTEFLSLGLRNLSNAPVDIVHDDAGIESVKEKLSEIRNAGDRPIAVVCSHVHLNWLCGPRWWEANTKALDPLQHGVFDSVPVIDLPHWEEGDVTILSARYFERTRIGNLRVETAWTEDSTSAIAERLDEAVKASPAGEVPEKFNVALRLEATVTFPFALVSPGDGFKFRVLGIKE